MNLEFGKLCLGSIFGPSVNSNYTRKNCSCNKIPSINPVLLFLKANMIFSVHGVLMDHPYDYKGTANLHFRNITSRVAFDLNNISEDVPNLDSLMMESKIGNSELTGAAEGIQQKLQMDITDLVSKVTTLHLYRFEMSRP